MKLSSIPYLRSTLSVTVVATAVWAGCGGGNPSDSSNVLNSPAGAAGSSVGGASGSPNTGGNPSEQGGQSGQPGAGGNPTGSAGGSPNTGGQAGASGESGTAGTSSAGAGGTTNGGAGGTAGAAGQGGATQTGGASGTAGTAGAAAAGGSAGAGGGNITVVNCTDLQRQLNEARDAAQSCSDNHVPTECTSADTVEDICCTTLVADKNSSYTQHYLDTLHLFKAASCPGSTCSILFCFSLITPCRFQPGTVLTPMCIPTSGHYGKCGNQCVAQKSL